MGRAVNKLWFLRRLDLFEGMSDPEMHQLALLMRDRTCRLGEDVTVRPSGDRIYLVKKGRVRVLSGDVAVAVLGPGQMFGTSAFFGAAAIDQRVVALDNVVICDAPAGRFLQMMASHPRLAAKMTMLMARQLFDLEQTAQRSATENVDQRLADLLLRLADREREPVRVRDLSQTDLARMIGASRESVSRALGRWERQHAVAIGQRSVDILDEDALRAVSNSG